MPRAQPAVPWPGCTTSLEQQERLGCQQRLSTVHCGGKKYPYRELRQPFAELVCNDMASLPHQRSFSSVLTQLWGQAVAAPPLSRVQPKSALKPSSAQVHGGHQLPQLPRAEFVSFWPRWNSPKFWLEHHHFDNGGHKKRRAW